ncbi:MAG TPA: DNA polymerase III subunit gamma/tau [Patescibacteria group bacterium]|nr:DNA polymerase III subunit gamma/tau [Patescibacteria group bacterium]
MVFYRKYRPQTINDLDSSEVREKLTAVLSAGSYSHAFLFTGPKGLGKTSTARIIAKSVNCERNAFAKEKSLEARKLSLEKKGNPASSLQPSASGIEPCNECDQCLSITNGSNLDVIEIDAASNRGIDEIRELKEKINLAPIQARKKVYIIDEVHMLTTEAFNALLKTLEEPPAHAIFILCTTEQHKIPATILSRCFHITFQPATLEELVRSLKRVSAGEKLKVDDGALETIAGLAEGGFRDATKLLEEVVALAAGQEITKKLVEEKLHVAGIQTEVNSLLDALQKRDTKVSLQVVEHLVQQKIDLLFFLQKVLEEVHNLFLTAILVETKQSPRHSRENGNLSEKIPKQVRDDVSTAQDDNLSYPKFDLAELQILTELLSQAYQQTKIAVIPQFPLELAIISWCVMDVEKNETSDDNQNGQPLIKDAQAGVSVASLRKHLGAIAKVKALYGEAAVTDKKVDSEPEIKTTSVSLLHFSPEGEITPQWLEGFWQSIVNEMKKYNHTVAGVLRSCKIKDFDRKNLIIEAGYQFHRDKLNEGKTLGNLEQVCKDLLGSPVMVKIELKAKNSA